MAIDQFEVYYFQNGRWHVHARYEAAEREIAVEEAKSVETNLGYPARVIRETFFPESNTTEEVVTYQGQRAKQIADADSMFGAGPQGGGPGAGPGASKPTRGGSGARGGRAAPQSGARSGGRGGTGAKQRGQQKSDGHQKQRTRKKAKNAIIQVLTGFVMSLVIAVIGSFAVAIILLQMLEAGMIPPGNRNPLVFGTFILLFFGSAFLYLNKHFNIVALFKKKPSAKRGAAPKTVPIAQAKAKKKKKVAPDDFDFGDQDLEVLAARIRAEDEEEEEEDGKPKDLDDEGFESEGGKKDAKKKKDGKDEAKKKKEAEKQAKQKEEKKKAEAKKKKEADKKKAEARKKGPVDAVKPDFLKFLTDAVTSIQKDHPQLNTFSKFGMNLYMCGACSTICQSKGIPNTAMLGLLKESLGIIGTNAQRAQSFCDDIPSYGSNPRYAGMIQAGGKAMADFMGGSNAPNAGLSALLTEWNLPDKRPSVPNMFTFLFTDIVGSTAMTQKLGNAGAQKAVRAHNDAVRGAIQQFNGREVKHTGDGIMATFPDGPSAVAGSIQMLQGIAAHNQANPDIPVEIRIGVNTGEAVEEENDFFGQAVQMTARICDKAADGHAWVSDIVVESCKGQRFGFLPRGEFEMKGIERPKPLYEIAWTDAHRDELADL